MPAPTQQPEQPHSSGQESPERPQAPDQPLTPAQEHRIARRTTTARDMVIAVLVLMVPIMGIVAFFSREPDAPAVQTVAWQPVVAHARSQAPYPVVAPKTLPKGWRVTRAQYADKGDTWVGQDIAQGDQMLLNLLTDQDVNVQLWQSNQPSGILLPKLTRDGADDGVAKVGAATWVRYLSADGRTRSIVLTTNGVSTVVVGDAGYSVLESFAASLST